MTALSLDIADPSDWLETSAPKLAPVESALRCQVCKDFFDTPMITSCSHTFCSLCIRRCLTNDGKCPTCRTPDQELRLRRNWTVQEIVDSFQAGRPSLISLATPQAEQTKVRKARAKRKVEDTDWEEDAEDLTLSVGRRKTRSQGQQQPQSPAPTTAAELTAVGRSAALSAAEPGKGPDIWTAGAAANPSIGDGLAACPICGQRMKEEAVFRHLDTHNEPNGAKKRESGSSKRSPSVEITGPSRAKPKTPERLPQLNYSLMKDNALRKKLADLGIPSTGPRALLMRRHAEWVNIVNANADSSRPKTKREMLRELDVWDRSTGRSIANSGTDLNNAGSIMSRDFDGTAWNLNHKSEFDDLVSKARHMSNTSKLSEPGQPINEAPRDSVLRTADVSTDPTPLTGGLMTRSNCPTLPDRDTTLESPSAMSYS
ncbi:MAG: hypothetical protein L6R39_001447 [Caloplaca ligustica]|nr:MAG: hypothetical protein L6R39_001447 [Caloplaca ligustica]